MSGISERTEVSEFSFHGFINMVQAFFDQFEDCLWHWWHVYVN